MKQNSNKCRQIGKNDTLKQQLYWMFLKTQIILKNKYEINVLIVIC